MNYIRKQENFPVKQGHSLTEKCRKSEEKACIYVHVFMLKSRGFDSLWLFNINAGHQPVKLTPCQVPDF